MAAKQTAENRSKVVIGVDDVPANLALLEVALRSVGYTFIGVASGAALLEVMNRVKPRLVLLDIRMPEMDGFETCRRLRLRRDFATVPVAFITACKTESDLRNGMAAGGNDFIVKPFTLQHLLERVAYWVAHPLRPGFALPPAAAP